MTLAIVLAFKVLAAIAYLAVIPATVYGVALLAAFSGPARMPKRRPRYVPRHAVSAGHQPSEVTA